MLTFFPFHEFLSYPIQQSPRAETHKSSRAGLNGSSRGTTDSDRIVAVAAGITYLSFYFRSIGGGSWESTCQSRTTSSSSSSAPKAAGEVAFIFIPFSLENTVI